MKVSILLYLREMIHEMVDKTDNGILVRTEPIAGGTISIKNLSDERIGLLVSITTLLLKTDFMTEVTKTYLSDKYISYKELASKIKLEEGIEINESTLQSRVWADKNKIERYFGKRFLLDIIEYTNIDITRYIMIVNELMNKFGKSNTLQKNIIIKLPESTATYIETSDSDFQEFISIITPYIKSQANYISNSISPNIISYCKYLLDGAGSLSGKDIERKEILLSLLK